MPFSSCHSVLAEPTWFFFHCQLLKWISSLIALVCLFLSPPPRSLHLSYTHATCPVFSSSPCLLNFPVATLWHWYHSEKPATWTSAVPFSSPVSELCATGVGSLNFEAHPDRGGCLTTLHYGRWTLAGRHGRGKACIIYKRSKCSPWVQKRLTEKKSFPSSSLCVWGGFAMSSETELVSQCSFILNIWCPECFLCWEAPAWTF